MLSGARGWRRRGERLKMYVRRGSTTRFRGSKHEVGGTSWNGSCRMANITVIMVPSCDAILQLAVSRPKLGLFEKERVLPAHKANNAVSSLYVCVYVRSFEVYGVVYYLAKMRDLKRTRTPTCGGTPYR